MNRQAWVLLIAGALIYYAFLKWRGVVTGAPWAPVPVVVGPRSAAA